MPGRQHLIQRTKSTRSSSRAAPAGQRRGHELPAQIRGLQQLAGNHAVMRWLSAQPYVQRACDACEDERRQLHRKHATPDHTGDASPRVESYVRGSHGAGHPLPTTTRASLESRFGTDFADVRIHSDHRAAEAAADVNADAFTIGSDIHFGAGRFTPGTSAGDRLLAHELTHVVQQGGGLTRGLQRQPGGPFGQLPDLPKPDFDCSIDLAAGKLQDFVNCCAKTPLGRGCSKDVIKGICKLPGVNCGDKPPGEKLICPPGFKPGRTKDHKGECCKEGSVAENDRVCCSPPRIVANSVNPRCCPKGTEPDATRQNCVTPLPPPPLKFCLPGQKTTKGECCPIPLVPRGDVCVAPPKPPPPPKPALVPFEIFFQKDRPSLKIKSTLANSLTAEGRANLDKLVALLRSDPSLKLQLVGKASPEGGDDYNMDLSRRRAEMIADALAGEGIDASRLANAPEGPPSEGCKTLRIGVFSCGEIGATGDSDRQVLASVIRPAP